ncbi:MFS transporter [Mycobacterium spongiae]|uniref:MFS transporter n=1 Tax=Mycobacterium spongiae TaxID=886343 RepID=A0A975PX86_9MYCO|nr:MFS transporter [Mycobacterium spongiae]QUR67483.1 MFS transporter [Mycobacterium spongiae]
MRMARFALTWVVLVDVMGQGLAFPIFNTLVTDPSAGFVQQNITASAAGMDYSVLVAAFFLTWFMGVVIISRLSDSVGRRWGILICLGGAFTGYVLTIVAVFIDSFALLLISRAITGFTAGTQPIAQAAMVDLSTNENEKARNMGLITLGISGGLVAGPLIGGVFSDKSLIGDIATLWLPFLIGGALNLVAMIFVFVWFHDRKTYHAPLRVNPLDIFRLLWEVKDHPAVMRVSGAFFFFQLSLLGAWIFIATYLTDTFGLKTGGTSLGMLVFGVGLGFASVVLVGPVTARFPRWAIVAAAQVGIIASIALFIGAQTPLIAYVALVPMAVCFGLAYPAILTVFSATAGEDRQGWVMGVQTALATLSAGSVSLLSGELLGLGPRAPFYVAILGGVIALLIMAMFWRAPTMRTPIGSASAQP